MLICPICHTDLTLQGKTYTCQNRHSYDVAKDGYVNLHVVQHKNSHSAGDTPASVQARRRFLMGGFYQPLRDKIFSIINELSPKTVLDIGCGEGYYTSSLAQHDRQVIGLDIAKAAIIAAAKAHKTSPNGNISWVVGTGAVLPVADGSVDVCTSFFSPLPVDEMLRVLASDGHLVVATPAPDHLYTMREALFGEVIAHDPHKFVASLAPAFVLIDEHRVHSDCMLDNAMLRDLIAMTPYAYKAKPELRAKLECMSGLAVRAEFCVFVFKKAKDKR